MRDTLSHQRNNVHNIPSHPSYEIITPRILLVCWLVVHCMVVWLTGIQYFHALAVQRSLAVVPPSQAFNGAVCEYRSNCNHIRDFFDRGVPDTNVKKREKERCQRHLRPSVVVATVYTGEADTRYQSIYRRKRARRNL